jgi:short-subunit dehydrogenase
MINKTAFITGSTSGIGQATVLELVKSVSTLILPVRSITKGEELKKSLLASIPIVRSTYTNVILKLSSQLESVQLALQITIR